MGHQSRRRQQPRAQGELKKEPSFSEEKEAKRLLFIGFWRIAPPETKKEPDEKEKGQQSLLLPHFTVMKFASRFWPSLTLSLKVSTVPPR
ncbi:MAG: hypothetical protein ABF665_13580 [Gluconacetobacter sp.]